MGIIDYAQYCLGEMPCADPLREPLVDIERESRRCIGIVQGLLTYSRSGDEAGEFVETDLWPIIERSVRLLDYRFRAEGVCLKIDKQEQLPPVPLNPNEVQQVIVKEHGGELTFTSRVGLGTTMMAQVPINRGSSEEQHGQAHSHHR